LNHLDEIRAKVSIEEIVGSYLQLKKAGRNLKGLCPFHNDSRPSFMVSPEKGIAYCFSCNTGGDIFKFIQLIETVDFPEAVRILADKAGVKLPDFKPEIHNEKLRIFKANELAADFYSEELRKSNKGIEYFKKRGLSDNTIKKFKLGYAPDSYHSLKDYLTQSSYGEKELLDAGLLNQRSIADKNTYDRFRHRYIFPITDHQGSVVGFGGRIIGEGEPKYLNSPDTPVYNKSFVLYGLNLAKEAIKKEDLAIFVEGYMDVIACHQAGNKNVVATSGTALTTGQLKLISRYTKNISFAFDQDRAGMDATKRAIELSQGTDLKIKIIHVPNGKDPDECIKESPEDWQKAVDNAIPVMDFYLGHSLSSYDRNTMEGKKEILNIMLPLIKLLSTSVEQNEYLTKLAYELKTDAKFLWEDMKRFKIQKSKFKKSPPESEKISTPKKASFSREDFLLGFILSNYELYPLIHVNLIDSTHFDPSTEKIYKVIKKVYSSRSAIELDEVKQELDEADREKLDILPLLIEEHYPDFSQESAEKEVMYLVRSINQKNIKTAQKEFEFKIRQATDSDERTLLLNEYTQILKLANKI